MRYSRPVRIFFGLIIGRVVWNKYVSDKKDIFVMYFDESLQGLREGAPIVFQGNVIRFVLLQLLEQNVQR